MHDLMTNDFVGATELLLIVTRQRIVSVRSVTLMCYLLLLLPAAQKKKTVEIRADQHGTTELIALINFCLTNLRME